ncbi:MAG: hypothetical protein Q4B29_01985 [Candidatus Saccharibacteria bacterium]|nr:hypothetical protein [Candidatus Saccharibacteria bacterium]
MRTGRTIGEQRERLEKSSERAAVHKKNKRKQKTRLTLTVLGFVVAITLAICLTLPLFGKREEPEYSPVVVAPYTPTIEVIDEDLTGSELPSRIKEYIGQAEADFRELGYTPVKVVIPSGAIREVRFYLDSYTGFIKLITDRGTGVSVEDADRMIHYLEEKGITDFEYIDVRVEGKAYWK